MAYVVRFARRLPMGAPVVGARDADLLAVERYYADGQFLGCERLAALRGSHHRVQGSAGMIGLDAEQSVSQRPVRHASAHAEPSAHGRRQVHAQLALVEFMPHPAQAP
ncbi:MAG: hypothetical protein JW751_25420 [Polyangiaceae bacterium]|nr:hypothetical protein [Polyangiaceae bacterium]